jgi:hypothetical protein
MAWLNNKSVINFGKYKGQKIESISDSDFIRSIHESKLNVYFTEDVFDRLKIKHKGLTKKEK